MRLDVDVHAAVVTSFARNGEVRGKKTYTRMPTMHGHQLRRMRRAGRAS
jgi:hypothetical protein